MKIDSSDALQQLQLSQRDDMDCRSGGLAQTPLFEYLTSQKEGEKVYF